MRLTARAGLLPGEPHLLVRGCTFTLLKIPLRQECIYVKDEAGQSFKMFNSVERDNLCNPLCSNKVICGLKNKTKKTPRSSVIYFAFNLFRYCCSVIQLQKLAAVISLPQSCANT